MPGPASKWRWLSDARMIRSWTLMTKDNFNLFNIFVEPSTPNSHWTAVICKFLKRMCQRILFHTSGHEREHWRYPRIWIRRCYLLHTTKNQGIEFEWKQKFACHNIFLQIIWTWCLLVGQDITVTEVVLRQDNQSGMTCRSVHGNFSFLNKWLFQMKSKTLECVTIQMYPH